MGERWKARYRAAPFLSGTLFIGAHQLLFFPGARTATARVMIIENAPMASTRAIRTKKYGDHLFLFTYWSVYWVIYLLVYSSFVLFGYFCVLLDVFLSALMSFLISRGLFCLNAAWNTLEFFSFLLHIDNTGGLRVIVSWIHFAFTMTGCT